VFPRHISGLNVDGGSVGQTGVVDHCCSPYQKAFMPRERQHRVTTVLKAVPHEQSTLLRLHPTPYG
jgi:hypothetical protein